MTGPEHYAKSERLLAVAYGMLRPPTDDEWLEAIS